MPKITTGGERMPEDLVPYPAWFDFAIKDLGPAESRATRQRLWEVLQTDPAWKLRIQELVDRLPERALLRVAWEDWQGSGASRADEEVT